MATATAARRPRRRFDFGDAILHVLQNEYDDIAVEFATEDVPEIAKGLVRLPVALAGGLWSAAKHIYNVGVSKAAEDLYDGAKAAAISAGEVPGRAKHAASFFYDEFVWQIERRNDTTAKASYIAKLSTYLATFAGGTALGYDTPDKDISVLGIGSHRNFLFHSAFIALGVKLTSRLLLRVLAKAERLVKKNSTDHDAIVFLATNLKTLSFGFAAGTAGHLFQDAVIDGDKSIVGPWSGTMISDTALDDDAWLLVNAVIAIMAGEEPKKVRRKKKAAKKRRRTSCKKTTARKAS